MQHLIYSPHSGRKLDPHVDVILESEYREPDVARWLFNPWTGRMRSADDIDRDPHGLGIKPPGPLEAAIVQATKGLLSAEDSARQDAGLPPLKDLKVANPLDVQVAGDHYKSLKIQPIEYIHANGIPFAEGSVIKYVTRWRDKGGIKDLEKARHFLDLLIELEKRRG
jgi:hypothetical protein